MILPREVQKALLKRVFTLGHFRAPVSVKAWPREDDTALCHPTIRWGSNCFPPPTPGLTPWATLYRLAVRRGSGFGLPNGRLARGACQYIESRAAWRA